MFSTCIQELAEISHISADMVHVREHVSAVMGAKGALSNVPQVTCEVANMLLPANMRRQVAPPPRQRDVCIVTGQPARYKDPLTLQPYRDSAAFLALRHHFASRQQYAPEPLEPHVLNRSERRRTGAGRALGSIDLQNME